MHSRKCRQNICSLNPRQGLVGSRTNNSEYAQQHSIRHLRKNFIDDGNLAVPSIS